MTKVFLVLFAITLLSAQAFADINFTCRGKHNGVPVVVTGSFPGVTSFSSINSTVWVDGRDVSRFYKGQTKVSMFSQSFKSKNNHGDLMEGSVVSYGDKKGKIKHLVAPGHGIDFWNIQMNCR